MEKLIEDVLIDVLQLLAVGVLSLIGYYVYHSATYKQLEKLVLAVEKKSPVLDTLIDKVKADAEKLLDSQEAKDATAQAIVDVLKKKGLKNVTADEVAKVIDELKAKGTEAVKEQAATTRGQAQK
ncbi:hypothetical protein [Sporolactobacillus inulinus]|jgi:hypothetical protein|uniref:Phage holin n=2 Tax=Sporolactobacillus inulinus TaxID=2078 RepID=A0A4Y1ZJ86_9BACL|nr:hypothetical protein [Sporolactobacillus inulinus]KLI01752.1 hypothetical protein SINU_11745 [Sporolactobacillus inulinus CASD]GAY79089.1 hypothetical protein NBRC111894_4643 [Sporolactobacillus inulinus]GEB78437.1 hypothetical protein SIN01_27820 [Sporolactobacillus inulinus]